MSDRPNAAATDEPRATQAQVEERITRGSRLSTGTLSRPLRGSVHWKEVTMGWFGGKSSHEKQVEAAVKVLGNLFEKTTDGGADAPLVLKFDLRDSRFRYFVFCLSTVQMACARRMKDPDAVLNDLLHTVVAGALGTDPRQFFGGPVDPQQAANRAGEYLEDYLHRWSAYVDIVQGGNTAAATGIVAGMLRHAESANLPTQEDSRRLWPLATWIEEGLDAMAAVFTNNAR
jgi:hypothetical protein